jgi:hypothetical protein
MSGDGMDCFVPRNDAGLSLRLPRHYVPRNDRSVAIHDPEIATSRHVASSSRLKAVIARSAATWQSTPLDHP